jgi:riboflavin-specific deaminase-like protein
VAALDPSADAPDDRPLVALNMVVTADGKVTIGGRSGPIGNEADRDLFHALRTKFDAVMIGAETLRVERYGRIVKDPAVREQRASEGLEPDPLAIVVSGRLLLPTDIPLLQEPEQRVAILTAAEGELQDCAARISYLRTPGGRVELGRLLPRLRADDGVRSILCEGGPTLNGSLLGEGFVDELFLSVAPKLIGGETPSAVAGNPLPSPLDYDLASVHESGGHLFLRYRLAR